MKTASEKNDSGPADPFKPGELKEVQGPSYAGERPLKRLENLAEEVKDVTGLDFQSFDYFRVEDLPEDSIAQTRRQKYSGSSGDYVLTVLAADPQLLDLPGELKTHALVHENVHSRHFNGRLYETLIGEGMSGEEAGKLESIMEADESRLEGATEIITHFLDPESEKVGKRFYPDEMELVEKELDPGNELLKEIKAVEKQVLDEYREVYQFETAEGLYREKGSFAGREYDALVLGENAEVYGEDLIGDYLLEEGYDDNEYQEFVESNGYDGDVLENTVVQDYLE